MNPVKDHPNAIVGGVGGIGGGAAVVEILDLAGVHVSSTLAAVIAGASASLLLFVGRNGLAGLGRALWRGTGR